MKKYAVLFNPLAGNGKCDIQVKQLDDILKDSEITYVDMTKITDYQEFFKSLEVDVEIVIAGGDGTLNRFINDADPIDMTKNYYHYGLGTGNDFLTDLGADKNSIVDVKEYIINLPVVEVNGKKYKFINGVGYGIDGYCCEEGDKIRQNSPGKDINYTSIAIKGLLFGFKRVNATIVVDGEKHEYARVWLAPTMNGRYYGGGMNAAPTQDRLNPDGLVTVMIMHHFSKLKTLMVFPSIFKGEHVKHTEMVKCFAGHDIDVTFDKPTALQIDGETIVGVTHYHVYADSASRK